MNGKAKPGRLEKWKRHYSLDEIKVLICNEATRVITQTALNHAVGLQLGNNESKVIVECIKSLSPKDFFKSQPSDRDHSLWHDIYRPTFRGRRLYVKVQIGHDGKAVVIQFKRKEESL